MTYGRGATGKIGASQNGAPDKPRGPAKEISRGSAQRPRPAPSFQPTEQAERPRTYEGQVAARAKKLAAIPAETRTRYIAELNKFQPPRLIVINH